jgi:hypothetical protein
MIELEVEPFNEMEKKIWGGGNQEFCCIHNTLLCLRCLFTSK